MSDVPVGSGGSSQLDVPAVCCSEVHVVYPADQQDTEGKLFLPDIFSNSYYCQVYSRLKIQLSSLQSLPMALGHQSQKRKLDMILPIGFSAERNLIFYIYINNLVLKMHLLAKIAVKYTAMKSCK